MWARRGRVLPGEPAPDLLGSELLNADQLKDWAVALASSHRVDAHPGEDKLLNRLAENERVLVEAHSAVIAPATPGKRILPAEAWLLDNFYLIEQQIALARRHLPRGYSRQLPKLAGGPLAGFPRIYGVALELISHQDGLVDRDNATAFLAAYQSVEPLNLGSSGRSQPRCGWRCSRTSVAWARASPAAGRSATWPSPGPIACSRPPKRRRGSSSTCSPTSPTPTYCSTAPFVEEFFARLQIQGPAFAFVQSWLEHRLAEQGVSAVQLLETSSRMAAADQLSIANSVGSLRFISAMDWGEFVERLSIVEGLLRGDPAGV